MKPRNSCLPWILLLAMVVGLGLLVAAVFLPLAVQQSFGKPSPSLNAWQRFSYGYQLVWNAGDLTQPRNATGAEQLFIIQPGESVVSI
jgi:hypothetical protein